MLPVVILMGGFAKRMRPLTETVPKALLPVASRPFIDWQLELLERQGIKKVILCVGHLGEQIEEHVSMRSYGMNIMFSFDGEAQLGTGGAVKKAAVLTQGEFFVLYGDSYLETDYAQVEKTWRESGKSALLTVFRNEDRWDISNTAFQDGRILRYSKTERDVDMKYIDYGLGILTSKLLDDYGQRFDLADVYSRLAAKGRLAGYEARNRFYEIGSFGGLEELEQKLLDENRRIFTDEVQGERNAK